MNDTATNNAQENQPAVARFDVGPTVAGSGAVVGGDR